MLTAAEEAELHQLLPGSTGAPPSPPSTAVAAADLIELRDRLVFDTAWGQGSWRLEQTRRDVDFCEQEESGAWTACVSVVVRLHTLSGSVHDETGTGRASEASADQASVETIATRRAFQGGARRLAKLFAVSIGQAAMRSIEKQIQQASHGHARPGSRRY